MSMTMKDRLQNEKLTWLDMEIETALASWLETPLAWMVRVGFVPRVKMKIT
jgi:hypothetical protein